MIVLSRLRQIQPHQLIKSANSLRHGGGGHGLEIYPSNLTHFRAKNLMHLWFVTPIAIVMLASGYKNLTEGEAMLADTPPGYKPYNFEYEKYPGTRWFTKMFRSDINHDYERVLFVIAYHHEKQMLREINNQVTLMMKQKKDTFSFFNRYHTAKYARVALNSGQRVDVRDRIHPHIYSNFDEDLK